MNIKDSLLFQMYQMSSHVSVPDFGASNTPAEKDKPSFQDLMKQAGKDTSKPSSERDEKATESSASQKKPTDTSADTDKQEESMVLEQAAALLYRPEIQMLASNPESTADSVILIQQTGQEATTPAFLTATMDTAQAEGLVDDTQLSLQPDSTTASEFDLVSSPTTAEDTLEQTFSQTDLSNSPDTDSEFTSSDLSGEVLHTEQPLFRDTEQIPVKVGNSYEVDTTAPDMDKALADSIRNAAQEGMQKVEIRLTPEHLGTVTVELTQTRDGTLQIVLHAANSKSAGLLSEHLNTLNMALQNLNQNQVHVEVERNPESSASQQQFHQQANPDGHGQQQHQQQQRESRQTSEDFLHQLRLGLFSLDESM